MGPFGSGNQAAILLRVTVVIHYNIFGLIFRPVSVVLIHANRDVCHSWEQLLCENLPSPEKKRQEKKKKACDLIIAVALWLHHQRVALL